MATINSNNAYVRFNSIDLSPYWTGEIDKTAESSSVETTAGAGQTHVQRAGGLKDNTMSLMVVFDKADLPLYRAALVYGTVSTLTYGPDGHATGDPKFESLMHLKSVSGPNATIDMQMQSFECEFEGADTPTATIEGGSTF